MVRTLRRFLSGPLRSIALLLLVVLLAPHVVSAVAAAASAADSDKVPSTAAPIEFWNRQIAVLRGNLAGATPRERAAAASARLDQLPIRTRATDIETTPINVDGTDGVGFTYQGRVLFFVGTSDLDKESRQTLPKASEQVLRNLDEALLARADERSWPVIRRGLLHTVIGLVLLVLLIVVVWKGYARVVHFLQSKEHSIPVMLRLFGVDLRPHLTLLLYAVLRTLAWALTIGAIYAWLTVSLERFPYTQPWGERLGKYVLDLVEHLVGSAVHALPGLLAVFIIFLIARWVVRLGQAFFRQVAAGRIRIYWMDADVAFATERVFTAVAWIFAVVVAYPYIPGSGTDAFKGISVFFGLVISLGSTGIINQIMSGLFVVYSRALKTGEWVHVNETEGEVLEVGLLAAKIRTIEGQEVTIPNSVLVGTSTKNYTRLGYPDGMVISSTVTIGYDAPWRQVHALLLLAAERTPNVRKKPVPYVLQRQLSDFYVEYTLIARLENEKLRIETLSSLHANIQDAFNEFGVQIMSPHYMMQPEGNVVVPPSKWRTAPAEGLPPERAKPSVAGE